MIGIIIPEAASDSNKEDKVNKVYDWDIIQPELYPSVPLTYESIKDLQNQIDNIWTPRTHTLRYTANAVLSAQTLWQTHIRDSAHFQNPAFTYTNFNPNNVNGTSFDWRTFNDIVPFNCKIKSARVKFQSGTTAAVDFAVYTANLPQGSALYPTEQGTNRIVNVRETLSLTATNAFSHKIISPTNITDSIIHEGAFLTVLFNTGNLAVNLYSFTLILNLEEIQL